MMCIRASSTLTMGQVSSSRVVDVMERICRAAAAAAVKTSRAVLVQTLLALAGIAVSWRSPSWLVPHGRAAVDRDGELRANWPACWSWLA
jgi:hypothetical protein